MSKNGDGFYNWLKLLLPYGILSKDNNSNIFIWLVVTLDATETRYFKGRVQKKLMDWSIKGVVGGSGGGQNPLKKNMPLKSFLGKNKSF